MNEVGSQEGVYFGPIGTSFLRWRGTIIGPVSTYSNVAYNQKGTPYAGSFFQLEILIPKTMAFSFPIYKFSTQIYHPNIGIDGSIHPSPPLYWPTSIAKGMLWLVISP